MADGHDSEPRRDSYHGPVAHPACLRQGQRSPILIGKAATVIQMICVLWALMKLSPQILFFWPLAPSRPRLSLGLFMCSKAFVNSAPAHRALQAPVKPFDLRLR